MHLDRSKAAIASFESAVVFNLKLSSPTHGEVLNWSRVELWDPSGKGRARTNGSRSKPSTKPGAWNAPTPPLVIPTPVERPPVWSLEY